MNGRSSGSICRGALIVLEGCDRSGKSTQCSKLVEKLRSNGKPVAHMRFPNRQTAIGQMIDSYLKQTKDLDDHAIHLLFSANRWEMFHKMKDLLYSGTTVIVDRYAYSGVAFTAAKGLDVDWCRQPDMGLIKPDKVIHMTVSSECAAMRSEFGEERYEKPEFQQQVKEVYNQLYDPTYWQTVNGDAEIEEVHKQVYTIAVETIDQIKGRPLERLWQDGNITS